MKQNFGSVTKPLHTGLCARSGVTAAQLSEDGFTADATVVSGSRGFWDPYGPADRDAFTFNLDDWALVSKGVHIKYCPCCYFTHTSIAATQALVDSHNIDSAEIEGIQGRAAQGRRIHSITPPPERDWEQRFR